MKTESTQEQKLAKEKNVEIKAVVQFCLGVRKKLKICQPTIVQCLRAQQK